jgi:phenylalanyl-tRNA synthetase alpha chain
MEIKVDTNEQEQILADLLARTDAESLRMQRYLNMPDLSRTEGSPLCEIVKNTRSIPILKDFDNIIIPEIVPADISFDLFNFAPNHPARSKSDTYYVDDVNILRTHDTVMWHYYLTNPDIQNKIKNNEDLGVICYGKVYRKDEIDRRHMNIFHQMGGLYLVPDSKKVLTLDDLKNALVQIVEGLFGKEVSYRFLDDTFPYTDPSLQIEVELNGKWVEIMGGGMPRKDVLKNFGVEGYNGWAFGFGLERLAIIGMQLPDIRLLWSNDERVKKQLVLGNIYKEVSRYPAVIRDISFVVSKTFSPNDYFDLVRDVLGDMAEEVALMDEYENDAKFGADKKSYAYRITYRSLERTLTDDEVNTLHKQLEQKTNEFFGATVR